MGRSGKLAARTVPVASLDAAAREAMWMLFARHYEGTSRETFDADLAEKRDVILAYDAGDGSIQGFSTLTWAYHRHAGKRFIAIFSGDTIVAPEYWGQRALQDRFGRYITRVWATHPFTRIHWLLVSKGYKTYLLLTRNFPEHWPRHDRPTPSWEQGALDMLARDRFGAAYDARSGVIRAAHKDRLREGVAPIPEEILIQADVRFFHEANPGHARGDELACLGRVGPRVWLGYLWKGARRRVARASEGRPWSAS